MQNPFRRKPVVPYLEDHKPKLASPRVGIFAPTPVYHRSPFPSQEQPKTSIFSSSLRGRTYDTLSRSSPYSSPKFPRNDEEQSKARAQSPLFSSNDGRLSSFQTRLKPSHLSASQLFSHHNHQKKSQSPQPKSDYGIFRSQAWREKAFDSKVDKSIKPDQGGRSLFSQFISQNDKSFYSQDRKQSSPTKGFPSGPYFSSHRPSQKVPPQPQDKSQEPLIPKEVSRCYRIHDEERLRIEEELKILGIGIENALTPSSGLFAMEGYLYNKFPKEADEESKDALREEPASAPSLLHEGVEFPVNSVKWNEMKEKNSQPSTLYPAQVMGVDELAARQQHQVNEYFEGTQRLKKMAALFKEAQDENKYHNEKALKRITRKMEKVMKVQAAARGLIEGKLTEKQELTPQYSPNTQILSQTAYQFLDTQNQISEDVETLRKMGKTERVETYKKLSEVVFNLLKRKQEEGTEGSRGGRSGTSDVLEECLMKLRSAESEQRKVKEEVERMSELARRIAQFST